MVLRGKYEQPDILAFNEQILSTREHRPRNGEIESPSKGKNQQKGIV